MRSTSDYPPDAVGAAKSVLVELVHVLGEYRDDMVVGGGRVPPLLMPDSRGHVGSTDVDVALNHLAENDEAYARISTLLRDRGHEQDEKQPFIWYRSVDVDGCGGTFKQRQAADCGFHVILFGKHVRVNCIWGRPDDLPAPSGMNHAGSAGG